MGLGNCAGKGAVVLGGASARIEIENSLPICSSTGDFGIEPDGRQDEISVGFDQVRENNSGYAGDGVLKSGDDAENPRVPAKELLSMFDRFEGVGNSLNRESVGPTRDQKFVCVAKNVLNHK